MVWVGIVLFIPASWSSMRVGFPDPPALEKCANGICLCNLLRSTQSNNWETVILCKKKIQRKCM